MEVSPRNSENGIYQRLIVIHDHFNMAASILFYSSTCTAYYHSSLFDTLAYIYASMVGNSQQNHHRNCFLNRKKEHTNRLNERHIQIHTHTHNKSPAAHYTLKKQIENEAKNMKKAIFKCVRCKSEWKKTCACVYVCGIQRRLHSMLGMAAIWNRRKIITLTVLWILSGC